MLWNKTYGGPLNEVCGDMSQTSDGGYVLSGNTASFGAAGGMDVYLVRVDASGNMLWNKTYGGSGSEYALTVIQTADSGFAMIGYTNSFGAGNNDIYVIKTDAAGNMQWNKTYGGPNADMGYGLVQTSDGAYIFSGYTSSFGAGLQDFWLFRVDASGNMLWNKTYGGTGSDYGYGVVQTSDGGYAMTGRTTSFGGDNAYLVRTDASGNMLWNKTYGEPNFTQFWRGLHLIQTADGGFAIVGTTYANGQDILLIKTDTAGNLQWNKTYGGSNADMGYGLVQTSDGAYIFSGYTSSFGAGLQDFW
ncbi:MAG TPA: hypothetical protein VJ508_16265, partial [Saprospiraceae bacterium]|nr:hypothetical protein [Saprospiraceae bacterium]